MRRPFRLAVKRTLKLSNAKLKVPLNKFLRDFHLQVPRFCQRRNSKVRSWEYSEDSWNWSKFFPESFIPWLLYLSVRRIKIIKLRELEIVQRSYSFRFHRQEGRTPMYWLSIKYSITFCILISPLYFAGYFWAHLVCQDVLRFRMPFEIYNRNLPLHWMLSYPE